MLNTHLIPLYQRILNKLQFLDGLPSLLIRLILAPVMIIAGFNKLALSGDVTHIYQYFLASEDIVAWFGNSEWGLSLPMPSVLAFLAAWTEFLGGIFILLGLFTRLTAIPLMITMLVAATTVHASNGWFAVTPTDASTSPARVLNWLAIPGSEASLVNSNEASERLTKMRELLETHGYTEYLYAKGKPVILNNGIEFSAIYFVMLLSLFFTGGGRFVSIDYWLTRKVSNSFIAHKDQ
ncbi:DoxX family protein [Pseudoalteromonas gelatinilytica]|uniref:HvfX family Cu-binding RiPP maturation protein n=1 Tax=Pseudoalteromonas gelatinilytica TaxID=1703256 RepID=UPI0007C51B33|nr:DoxX family protein [Pseudoalteromonas gelatinilytica]